MADAVAEVTFDLLELHHEALMEVLPDDHTLKAKLQTKLIAADVVRRYVTHAPPDRSKTDWWKLLSLLVPLLTLLAAIVATLLGIDWKGLPL